MKNEQLKIRRDESGQITSISVTVNVAIIKSEAQYRIFCPAFQTFGYSCDNEEEALEDFYNSLKVWFKVHINRDSLEKALETFSWDKTSEKYIPKPELSPTARTPLTLDFAMAA